MDRTYILHRIYTSENSAVEVHELHTRTMAIHDYNVTFE